MINIENDGVCKFSVKGEHVTLRAITLRSKTDNHDTLVEECKRYMFRGKIKQTEGHIFILYDMPKETATVFIVAVPDYFVPTLEIKDNTVFIKTSGYPVSVGYSKISEAEQLVRDWYRMQYRPTSLHTMSNTWGDRNGRDRVSEEFVRAEIDSAQDLGLDVVQIDDGWQKGIPDVYDDEGNRVFDGDFWKVKYDRFPCGMESVSKYARNKEVELGLWFAPESRLNFKSFERDISVLRQAYKEWKIKYFKLDMVKLENEDAAGKMLDFLDEIFSFGDDVSVELDVTADVRLGYLMSAPYGTVFVENRYTEWSNYYPHRTLRNLWLLSRFIPASKFQFELLNPELCTDKYNSDDALRPELYDIDYLFASVMYSNPLFWMETQFLSEESRARLKRIIGIWKKHRKAITNADVYPIGEEPSGVSMTGFSADTGDEIYVSVFRECTERESFTFDLGQQVTGDCELIASNTAVEFSANGSSLAVDFSKMRSYAWFVLKKK